MKIILRICLLTILSNLLYSQPASYFPYNVGDKYSIADINGNIVSQHLFNEIRYLKFSKTYFNVKDDNGYFIADQLGKNLISKYYQGLSYERSLVYESYYTTAKNEELKDIYQVTATLNNGSNVTLLLKLNDNKLDFIELKDINQFYQENGIYKNDDFNCLKSGFVPVVYNNGINLFNSNLLPLFKSEYVDVSCLTDNLFSVTNKFGETYLVNILNEKINEDDFIKYKRTLRTTHFIGIKNGENSSFLINEKGETIAGPYTNIEELNEDYLIAKREDLILLSFDGKEELILKEGYVKSLNNGKIEYTNYPETIVYDRNLKPILKLQNTRLKEAFYGDYYIFLKDNKYGVIDTNGIIKIEPIYENLSYNKLGNCLISKINGFVGVIDSNLINIVPNEYLKIDTYVSTIIATNDKKRRYKFDYNGNVISPDLEIVFNGFSILYNKNNVIISDSTFKELEIIESHNKEKCVIATKKGSFNKKTSLDVFDINGNSILPQDCYFMKYSEGETFLSKGLVLVINNENSKLQGVLNFTGEWVLPLSNQKLTIVGEMIIANTAYGIKVYDLKGKYLLLNVKSIGNYNATEPFVAEYHYSQYPIEEIENEKKKSKDKNDYEIVNYTENRVFGYVDKNGNSIINPQFSVAKDFLNGSAIVGIYGGVKPKTMIIDTLGKIILTTNHDFLQHVTDENSYFITVNKTDFGANYGLCDLKGKDILPTVHKSIDKLDKFWIAIKPSGEGCIYDSLFNIIYSGPNIPETSYITEVNKRFLLLKSMGKTLVINLQKKDSYYIDPSYYIEIVDEKNNLVKVGTTQENYLLRLDSKKAFKD